MTRVPNSVDWRRRAKGLPPRTPAAAPPPQRMTQSSTDNVGLLGVEYNADGTKKTLAERLGMKTPTKPSAAGNEQQQVPQQSTTSEPGATGDESQQSHSATSEPSATGAESQQLRSHTDPGDAAQSQLGEQGAETVTRHRPGRRGQSRGA
jgi:hypothetical protein